jgi:3-hydroxybutyryl-CoA dehydrogenase
MRVRTAGVVGLGTMGAGIAEVLGKSGLDVVAVEVDEGLLARGRGRIESSLQRAVDRGRLDESAKSAQLDRTTYTTDRAALAAADVVVEAIPERLELKAALFDDLDRICRDDAVLATNTSSLPVTQIAAATAHPERVVGMHFFNPAPVMKLVEVVRTVLTAQDVVDTVRDLAESAGKTPLVIGDRAGFIANALLFGYLNDAALMAERGHADITDIDSTIAEAAGLPMGPIALMDLIGLDVCLEVLEVMYAERRETRYAPAPLLKRLVLARHLGRKSGRGYYRYDGKHAEPAVVVGNQLARAVKERQRNDYLVETLLYPHLNDAVQMADEGYATPEQIDTAMKLGCGYSRGPFELIANFGPSTVAEGLQRAGHPASPLLGSL